MADNGQANALKRLDDMLNAGQLTYDQYMSIINGLAEGGEYSKYDWTDNGVLNSYNLTPEERQSYKTKAQSGLKGYMDKFTSTNPIVSKFGGDLDAWFKNNVATKGRTIGSMYQNDPDYLQYKDLMAKSGAEIPDLQQTWTGNTKKTIGNVTGGTPYFQQERAKDEGLVDLTALKNMDKYNSFVNRDAANVNNSAKTTTEDLIKDTTPEKDTTTNTDIVSDQNKTTPFSIGQSDSYKREPSAFTSVNDILGKFKVNPYAMRVNSQKKGQQKTDTMTPEELAWLTKIQGGMR